MLKRKAFTLVELLVVIAIIGLLATLSVIALNSARAKSRDAKRVTDVKQISTALELFFNDAGRYPTNLEWASGSLEYNGQTYLTTIPSAPSPADGTCDNNTNTFSYTQDNAGESYTITFCTGANINSLPAGPLCATPGGMAACGGGGGFSCGTNVSYGGESYPTVQIGNQCWFAKNLNVGTRVDSAGSAPCVDVSPNNRWWSCQIDDSQTEKYCYDNDDSNCTTDGGLYEWAEALQLPYDCNYANSTDNGDGTYTVLCSSGNQTISVQHQGICPTGWHIPSLQELNILAQNADPGCDLISGNCSTAGGKLKATGSHSPISWDGTDDYDFSALPSGYRNVNGSFYVRGDNAYLWSSMPFSGDPYDAWVGLLLSGNTSFNGTLDFRAFGFSVRCAQD